MATLRASTFSFISWSVLCVAVVCDTSSPTTTDTRLHNSSLCHTLEQLKSLDCVVTVKSRGSLDCNRRCLRDPHCWGTQFVKPYDCNLIQTCSLDTCSEESAVDWFYKREDVSPRCFNNGSWNASDEKCECSGGFVGSRCERYASSCAEIASYYQAGAHFVYIKLSSLSYPVRVLCSNYRLAQKRTYIFQHDSSGPVYNKTWDEFVNGFNDEDYWIGLKPLHYIYTELGLDHATILVKVGREENESKLNYTYSGFRVNNESLNYSFNFDSSRTTLNGSLFDDSIDLDLVTSCLDPLEGAPFSTWDNDNDLDPSVNCAAKHGAGFWYGGCDNQCHPLGEEFDPSNSEEAATPEHMQVPGLHLKDYRIDFRFISMYFH